MPPNSDALPPGISRNPPPPSEISQTTFEEIFDDEPLSLVYKLEPAVTGDELRHLPHFQALVELMRNLMTRTNYVYKHSKPQPIHYEAPRMSQKRLSEVKPYEQKICKQDTTKLSELVVWHGGNSYRFYGMNAFERLSLLTPSAYTNSVPPSRDVTNGKSPGSGRQGALVAYFIDQSLQIHVSANTLARALNGGMKFKMPISALIPRLIHDQDFVVDPRFQGYLINRRYLECFTMAFTTFDIISKSEPDFRQGLKSLGNFLVHAILRAGRCEAPEVVYFKDALEVVIHGTPRDTFEAAVLEYPKPVQAILYRTRRIFYKDDVIPIENCVKAISRMSEPVVESSDDIIARGCLAEFRSELRRWLDVHAHDLPIWISKCGVHRSSASVLYPRSRGGGSRELHLIVGLYRLSRGISSPLQDVWGRHPSDIGFEALAESLNIVPEHREEILAAAEWWMNEVVCARNLARPFLCIYPEREPKSRTFMLLDWATQQGCKFATDILYRFLGDIPYCKEAFRGFRTGSVRSALARNDGEFTLSLDSAVSTDPLRHDFALEIYEDILPHLPKFAQTAIRKTFSPMKVGAAIKRPKFTFMDIGLGRSLFQTLGLSVEIVEKEVGGYPPPKHRVEFYPNDVPTSIVVHARMYDIILALREHGRVMVKSPTGTGKTVLAASGFRSIIQFPSIANLELFSASCRHFNIRHNKWYSLKKGKPTLQPEEEDEAARNLDKDIHGIPYTILTTGFYVMQLHKRYPTMLVVLDEAETRTEDFLLNVLETREVGASTLLMSATPDSLSDHGGFMLELTNPNIYPIEEKTISFLDMIQMLKDPSTEKSLVCTFSEPHCAKISSLIGGPENGAFCLTQRERRGDFAQKVAEARVIISTNVVRSSVTIDGLIHVFDLGLMYEDVDLPAQGFSKLTLFDVPNSGRIQLRGRVGRVGPGTSWTVTGMKQKGIPSLQGIVSRPERSARRLRTLDFQTLSQPINRASAIIEYFSQTLISIAIGSRIRPGLPICLQVCAYFLEFEKCQRDISMILLYEGSSIPGGIRQLKDDEDYDELYKDILNKPRELSYVQHLKSVLPRIASVPHFSTEIQRFNKWLAGMEEDDDSRGLLITSAQKSIALTLWRQVGRVVSGVIVGSFRQFTCRMPPAQMTANGKYVVCMSLGVSRDAITCAGIVELHEEVFEWLVELVQESDVKVPLTIDESDTPLPVLSVNSLKNNSGSESRILELNPEMGEDSMTFLPDDLPDILDRIVSAVDKTLIPNTIRTTTRGSPMSSVASFGVLNGFSYAAMLPGIPGYVGFGFGDDHLGNGTRSGIDTYIRNREILGLQTKWSATGIIPRNSPGMCLYTERFFEPSDFREINSEKPRGLFSLWSALHPSSAISSKNLFAADYQGLSQHLLERASRYHEACTSDAEDVPLAYPIRSTIARKILSSALRKNVKENDLLLSRPSAEKFLVELEAALLVIEPSSRGIPHRVPEPPRAFLDNFFVPRSHAEKMLDTLAPSRAFAPGFSREDLAVESKNITFRIRDFALELGKDMNTAYGLPISALTEELGVPIQFDS